MAFYREFCARRLVEVQRSLGTVGRDVCRKRATIKLLERLHCRISAARVRELLGDMEKAQKALATEREQLARYLGLLPQVQVGVQPPQATVEPQATENVTGSLRATIRARYPAKRGSPAEATKPAVRGERPTPVYPPEHPISSATQATLPKPNSVRDQ